MHGQTYNSIETVRLGKWSIHVRMVISCMETVHACMIYRVSRQLVGKTDRVSIDAVVMHSLHALARVLALTHAHIVFAGSVDC